MSKPKMCSYTMRTDLRVSKHKMCSYTMRTDLGVSKHKMCSYTMSMDLGVSGLVNYFYTETHYTQLTMLLSCLLPFLKTTGRYLSDTQLGNGTHLQNRPKPFQLGKNSCYTAAEGEPTYK